MNKASAVGFAAGLIFLGLAMVFIGMGNVQEKPAATGKPVPAAPESRPAAPEESAEVDGGAKPAEKKLPEFKMPVNQPLAKTPPAGSGLIMARSATPGGYRTGQALDVIVSLNSNGRDKLTALALVERLPQGWTFQELSGGASPVITPAKGAAGELSFVWAQIPAFPFTVSYRIVPGPEVAGPQEFQGQAVYRQAGPEQRTEMVKTTVVPAAQ